MPTLGIDMRITLSTAETRSSLESFYRGIKVEGVVLRPYTSLINDVHIYNTTETNAIIFVSDEFEGTNPFDITLVSSEIDVNTQENKTLTLVGTGLLILDTSNIIEIRISNLAEKSFSYRLIS